MGTYSGIEAASAGTGSTTTGSYTGSLNSLMKSLGY